MYLGIPALSAASEPVFLAAGNVVTKKRKKLGDDTVDALVFWTVRTDWHGQGGISQEALGRKDK